MTDATPATAALQMPRPPEASGGPAGSVSGEKGQPENTTAAADPLRRSLDAIVGPPVDEETGAPTTAATERAEIVAWLRQRVREGDLILDDMADDSPNRAAMRTAVSTYATIADLIEEGAHHAD